MTAEHIGTLQHHINICCTAFTVIHMTTTITVHSQDSWPQKFLVMIRYHAIGNV